MGKKEAATLQEMQPEEIEDEDDHFCDVAYVMNSNSDVNEGFPLKGVLHQFYIVKIWPKDPNPISVLERAEKSMQEMSKLAIYEIIQKILEEKTVQDELTSTVNCLRNYNQALTENIASKRETVNHMNLALEKLFDPRYSYPREPNVNQNVKDELKLKFRMIHGAKSLVEEKQLLRDINKCQPKSTDDSFSILEELKDFITRRLYFFSDFHKLIAEIEKAQDGVSNSGGKGKHQNFLALGKAIGSQVKLLGDAILKEKEELLRVRSKIRPAKRKLQRVNKSLSLLRKQLLNTRLRKKEAQHRILQLRSEYETENTQYFEYRSFMKRVKQKTGTKDIAAIREISQTEVERFMSQWNSSKEFREDYVKTIMPSLEKRQLSMDGRMRNNLVESS